MNKEWLGLYSKIWDKRSILIFVLVVQHIQDVLAREIKNKKEQEQKIKIGTMKLEKKF